MSDEQAARVLTADLTLPPPAGIVDALIVECGRWPLLLRLVNKIVLDQSRSRTDISGIAGELLDLLRRFGVGQLDILTGAAKQTPDVNDPDQRDKAVAMTIEASLGLLASDEQARFANLAVFAEDEDIPVPLVTLLWQQTDPQDAAAGRALCARLADLALLTQTATDDGGTIGLHDVVRDYLRRQLGKEKLTDLHRDLLDAAVGTLPDDFRSDGFGEAGTTWWLLPDSARYLREHLVEHLLAAGRRTEAEALVTDLRWIQCRLVEAGPVGPDADLLLIDSRSAARLRRLWEQIAHLLTRTEPEHSLVDILYSRVDHDAVWGPQARRLAKGRTLPALTNLDPLPDLPHPALRRTLTGPPKAVTALAIAPDSSWLASASVSGQVRVWDSITGKQRLELIVGADGVTALAISADGSRLASAGFDGWVRAWDSNTGRPCLKVHGHKAERPQ
jgi:hypothetical protein